jgi:TrmH family RNA methyltransferase
MMERLESVKNPLIQRLRALKTSEGRASQQLFLVEGEKLMREAAALLAPAAALFEEGLDFGDLPEALRRKGARTLIVPRRVLEAVCDTRTPQGACAAFAPPAPLDLAVAPDRIVALDGVQDPGNLGTFWRTADAAGFQALIAGPGCAEALSPKVQRAAMGSGFRVPMARVEDLPAALRALAARGYAVVATSLEGEPFYQRAPLPDRFVLVIGSEARGVSPDGLAAATAALKLPMRGGAQSLNAAVAAGIMMYELCRNLP